MKILCNYGVPKEGFFPLEGHELVIPPPLETITREELSAHLPDTEVLIAAKPVTREMILAAPRLRLICAYGAGYDNIDLLAANERKVPVCNIPETVTNATAELTIGLMLSLCRRITELNGRMHRERPETLFGMGRNMGVSLEGLSLGIIGMGRIGQRVADLARCLGMQVTYFSKSRKPEREAMGDRFLPLEELLSGSDVVSLHCPLNESTYHLMNGRRIALMKNTAFLINTARGAVIEDAALVSALREHRIAGAALDVYAEEPKICSEYLQFENVIVTPHIGSNTERTRFMMARAIREAILCLDRGLLPEHIVRF